MCAYSSKFLEKSALTLFLIIQPVFGSASVTPVGFKDLLIGMSERSVPKTRKLSCKRGDNIFKNLTGAKLGALKQEIMRLNSLATYGDRRCTSSVNDTIGGMPIGSIELSFIADELVEIKFAIHESGISTATGRGYGEWSSDNLATLVRSLDSRYGPHKLKSNQVCDLGRCLRAPLEKTFLWSQLGASVTLIYVESTTNTRPSLRFLSEKFSLRSDALAAKTKRLREQIDQEEQLEKDKKMRARSRDM